MWYRYTEHLKSAVFRAYALQESEGLPALSTRHLLMGLAGFGASAEILRRLKAATSLDLTVPALHETTPKDAPQATLTTAARQVVDTAYAEAAALHDNFVGTEHFLIALLRVPDSEAAAMLAAQDVSLDAVVRELLSLHSWRTIVPAGATYNDNFLLLGRRFRSGLRSRAQHLVRMVLALTQLFDDPLVWSFLFTKQRLEHPHLFFRRLRKRGFYRSRALGGWIVSSYEDVQNALREPALSARRFDLPFLSNTPPLPPSIDQEFNTLFGGLTRQMIFLDAPEQTRIRSLVSRQFTPRVLAAMRQEIQQVTEQLLDAVAEQGKMDIITDFAFPLPATVIARLLGVDDRNLVQFKDWSDAFVHFISGAETLAEDLRAYHSLHALRHYFEDAVHAARSRPADSTLLSLLANASDEDGNRLTDDEVILNTMLLLAAGHETTTHLIGNGLLLLFRHPNALAQLKADPSLMPNAVEEMLRFEGPVQWNSRIARQPFTLHDQPIHRGETVAIALAAANRDPARFPDPDKFRIDRSDNKHMAFGYGAHFCLGAALARMETEIALSTLLRRFPAIRPADPHPHWRRDFTFRAQRSLPVLLK